MKVPERYRREGRRGENNGIFTIPHYKIKDYSYLAIVSDGMRWEHVSVSLVDNRKKKPKSVKRCPTWAEMCYVKALFWEDEEPVVQFHPPKSEWVSSHPYCLHLWRPSNGLFPRPPQILVGMPGDNVQSL